jgi:uncharacterized Zn-finger protein
MSETESVSSPLSGETLNEKIISVTSHKVACNGGGGALGHPMTYYVIPENETSVKCLYCDRIYQLKSQ